MPLQISHVFKNDRILTVQLTKGEERQVNQLWEWVVWLCFEGTEPEMQGKCGEDTRWRRNLLENGEKEKERFGRAKIIVTLSLDSTHYFSIQWAQCWGDMAEIQLQNTFDNGGAEMRRWIYSAIQYQHNIQLLSSQITAYRALDKSYNLFAEERYFLFV